MWDLPRPGHEPVSPALAGRFLPTAPPGKPSSKSFMVSSLTFRSRFHFEFIFVYGVRECSDFLLLHVAVQFSQHHLLKRLSFLHHISMTKEARIYTGENIFSSKVVLGKLDSYMSKN